MAFSCISLAISSKRLRHSSIVYSLSLGRPAEVVFNEHQRLELLLTLAQSVLGFFFLVNMEFRWHEALGLLGLWLVQFVIPESHVPVATAYFGWAAVELALLLAGRRKWNAIGAFGRQWRLAAAGRSRA